MNAVIWRENPCMDMISDKAFETPPSTPPTPHAENLHDIFSDSPPSSHDSALSAEVPSDVPRLRSIHATAGYREGVNASKQISLQPGFDEGFSLGAAFGLRVGYLLGLLDAVYAAVSNSTSVKVDDARRLRDLLHGSKQELNLETLFGKTFWGEDGLWKYDVQAHGNTSLNPEESAVFDDIIECHPLIQKWSVITADEAKTWGITQNPWLGIDWELGRLPNQ